MKYKTFTFPVFEDADSLNSFMANHRIYSVRKELVTRNEESYWAFLLEYEDSTEATAKTASDKKAKVDYREVLNDEDFLLYTKLRTVRKEIGNRTAVPLYAICTNEQLAKMASEKPQSKASLEKIEGFGKGKIDKYAVEFLQALKGEEDS